MKPTHIILVSLALGAGIFMLGRSSTGGAMGSDSGGHGTAGAPGEDAGPTLWTCPMHPQIKLPDEGDCPICGMDLVPMTSGGDEDPRRLVMTNAAKELARIEVAPAVRRNVSRPVRMTGKVDFDETAVRTISAWVGGRLDRLYVDYTGVMVNEGDHLVLLYSPELLTAQQELISATKRADVASTEASDFLRSSNERNYISAREKLLLLGLSLEQVDAIEARGTADDHVTINTPTAGVVIDKFVDEGGYVKTGTPIYRIADLSELWVRLDAYEQDLAWLRNGQPVFLEVEALPGETFEGRVVYIDPFIQAATRTAKVRVNVDNRDGRLKPGMFVSGVAMARLGGGGAVIDQFLAGKWVGPMHPEIVKDGPGVCDVCGMDLVPAEELGLVPTLDPNALRPIVVPTSAVLITGTRAVAYVEVPGTDKPTYEGRVVTLGPRAGDSYIVLSGIEEGERVVVNGSFRIDSSMQILARPSMMDQPGDKPELSGPEARVFQASLAPLFEAYLALHMALADDDEVAALEATQALGMALDGPSAAGLPTRARESWKEDSALLARTAEVAARSVDIEELRAAFETLSTAMISIERVFGDPGSEMLVAAFCPMAFDGKGATWLQAGDGILNPYFGASMLNCGEVRETFMSAGKTGSSMAEGAAGEHDHSSTAAAEAKTPLGGVFARYIELQQRLAADDEAGGKHAVEELLTAVLAATGDSTIEGPTMMLLHGMHSDLLKAEKVAGLEALRTAFRSLSERLIAIDEAEGNPLTTDIQLVHCPMAFEDEGADWFQIGETVSNPYFGSMMQTCGEIQRASTAEGK